ncbi:hypothetical protein EP073_12475 [Geovibrio thiophilus]|uniref:Uncharacterized protein n=1 Tax=Geovibrio thiophilus TaxID=139438 RepID=A0A3R5XYZ9_9BACT|nr:hypothetical protein [Geovibrio thiophilus]QAR34189.1 hypothetical protein EP073_12475 [Geovibrio thiophilus]
MIINKSIRKLADLFMRRANRAAINCYQQRSTVCTVKQKEYADLGDYLRFADSNSSMLLDCIKKIQVKKMGYKAKWVGGTLFGDMLFCIPNSADCVMVYNIKNDDVSYFGDVGSESYKWTSCCVYKDKIYGFPRSSNSLLEIDPQKMTVSLVPLNTSYKGEHHYAGAVTADGLMYLPPRDENHILAVDLNTYSAEKIPLCPSTLKIKFRYQNGILHYDGNIYFFPENNEKVLVLNPETKSFRYIGNKLNCYVFEAQICGDGNIYGFSNKKGILKIDVKNQTTEMLHNDIIFGSYGTKHGLNGKLYSMPGASSIIYEYDTGKDILTHVSSVEEQGKAKCAGGVTTDDGSIIAVPAYGDYLYRFKFNNVTTPLPAAMKHSLFYTSTY